MDSTPRDPTRMRNQPSLTTAEGTTWLVIGAISAVLLSVMFVALTGTEAARLSWIGLVVTICLLVAMMGVRIGVPLGRGRLLSLAGLYAVMLVVAFVLTLVIAVTG